MLKMDLIDDVDRVQVLVRPAGHVRRGVEQILPDPFRQRIVRVQVEIIWNFGSYSPLQHISQKQLSKNERFFGKIMFD